MERLKQGQRVNFKLTGLEGTGTIVGMSMTEQPVIGGTYIIEPDFPINNEEYDYSHFTLPQVYITLIED